MAQHAQPKARQIVGTPTNVASLGKGKGGSMNAPHAQRLGIRKGSLKHAGSSKVR